jgi:hypothetical protein
MQRKISQSFIKDFSNYLQGNSCGLQILAKFYDGVEFPSTKPQRLGQYFEYRLTGALPKNGKVPEADLVYKGTSREGFSEDYKRAEESVSFAKMVFDDLGITILDKGVRLENEEMVGDADIIAEWNGEKCIIDIKYSSVIDDKWSEYGWDSATLSEKDETLVQAVHYKMLAQDLWGIEDVPFYFFVFSAKDPGYAKIFKILVDEVRYETHKISVLRIRNKLSSINRDFFKAKPTLKRCLECPLFQDCGSKTTLPLVEEIYY